MSLFPLYLLTATTGMRRGEIAGLLWHNVDLNATRLNQQPADRVGSVQAH